MAIGLHAGQLRLLGYDTFEVKDRLPPPRSGFVFSDPRSGRVGEALLVVRVRAALTAGVSVTKFIVGSKGVLPFHERIADAAKVERPRGGGWGLNIQQMANVLAEWDRALSPEQQAALRAPAANDQAKLADVAAVIAPPVRLSPTPGRLPPGRSGPRASPSTRRRRAARPWPWAVFILELIRGVLRDRADKREDEQAQSQANAVPAAIAAHQAAKPTDGALVRMVFHRQALPDAPGPGQARFAYLEHGFGASESEARVAPTSSRSRHRSRAPTSASRRARMDPTRGARRAVRPTTAVSARGRRRHAVAVFPENEATRMAFERVPATVVGAWLPPLPNFELLRWVRPEDLRVFKRRLPVAAAQLTSCRSMPSFRRGSQARCSGFSARRPSMTSKRHSMARWRRWGPGR